MKKSLMLIIVCLSFFTCIPSIHAEQKLNLNSADSCILIDSKTGQVLYDLNSNKKGLFPASTTKIMTAIVAIEKGNLDAPVKISAEAVNDIGDGGMNIGIMAGEEGLTLRDILNAMLICSANECANIVAENVASTRSDFIGLMNQKAGELGATDTNFVNTCGIHNKNHYTTASDMAKIARYAMSLPEFRQIVEKKNLSLPPTSKHAAWPELPSTNRILGSELIENTVVNGIKTGYTTEAGHNLVSSAINETNGMELIAVVFGVRARDGAEAKKLCEEYSKALLRYGFENYSLQSIIEANQVVKTVGVTDADSGVKLDLVTAGSVSGVLPLKRDEWNIVRNEYFNLPLKAPVKKGDVVGYVSYERNSIPYGRVDIVASMEVGKSRKAVLADATKSILGNSLFLKVISSAVAALLIFIILRFTLRRISRSLNSRRHRD